jgi:hypothetical protein
MMTRDRRCLQHILSQVHPDQLTRRAGNRAIAAAEAVAGEEGDIVPPDLLEWREEWTPTPSADLVRLGLEALRRIRGGTLLQADLATSRS